MRIEIAALSLVGLTHSTTFDDPRKQLLFEKITSFADDLQEFPDENARQELHTAVDLIYSNVLYLNWK